MRDDGHVVGDRALKIFHMDLPGSPGSENGNCDLEKWAVNIPSALPYPRS